MLFTATFWAFKINSSFHDVIYLSHINLLTLNLSFEPFLLLKRPFDLFVDKFFLFLGLDIFIAINNFNQFIFVFAWINILDSQVFEVVRGLLREKNRLLIASQVYSLYFDPTEGLLIVVVRYIILYFFVCNNLIIINIILILFRVILTVINGIAIVIIAFNLFNFNHIDFEFRR